VVHIHNVVHTHFFSVVCVCLLLLRGHRACTFLPTHAHTPQHHARLRSASLPHHYVEWSLQGEVFRTALTRTSAGLMPLCVRSVEKTAEHVVTVLCSCCRKITMSRMVAFTYNLRSFCVVFLLTRILTWYVFHTYICTHRVSVWAHLLCGVFDRVCSVEGISTIFLGPLPLQSLSQKRLMAQVSEVHCSLSWGALAKHLFAWVGTCIGLSQETKDFWLIF